MSAPASSPTRTRTGSSMRHFIKRKPFSGPFSEKTERGVSSDPAELALECLDEVSCFETLRAYAGGVFRLERHLERLSGSCAGIGRELPLSPRVLAAWVREALGESGLREAVVRLSLHWTAKASGEAVVLVREWTPDQRSKKGIALITAVSRRPSPRSQDAQIKSSQFMNGVLAVLDEGDGDRLLLGPLGTVAEGVVSNIFIVRRKSLLTPSVASGILKGVTRGVVKELV